MVFVLTVAAGVGWIRPRWSSLAVAVVPGGLAFAWLLMHEQIPGDETTMADIAWYLGMSLVVAAVIALACACGVLVRRALPL